MPKVFISHSWDDNEISRKIAASLKRDGADIWIDYARISGGDSLPEVIGDANEWCDTMVLIWSASAAKSYFVKLEWTCAFSNQKRIIPCMIDSTKLPTILSGFLWLDFRNFEAGYLSLTHTLTPAASPETITLASKLKFRSVPKELAIDDVKPILKNLDFFDISWNDSANGFTNNFVEENISGDPVIFDQVSDLMWQQSGSLNWMAYEEAKKYIEKTNQEKFAGFSDWRLPTLEEAMSLLEIQAGKNGLFISNIFDSKQRWIWTSDPVRGESRAYVVYFNYGECNCYRFYDSSCVRAVRSGQSSLKNVDYLDI